MEDAVYIKMHEVEQTHWWFVGRRRVVDRLLNVFAPKHVQRALDVGCGTGNNFPLLSRYADEVDGLECSPLVLDYARKTPFKHGRIIQGLFPSQAGLLPPYDLLTLFDVLEHIEDDVSAVRQVEALLAPGGIAVFTVPAFPFLWTEFDVAMHHFRRYTKRSLISLFANHTRLTVSKISYMNFFFFPPIVVIRWVKRLLGLPAGSGELALPTSWVNTVLTRVFSSEARWLEKHAFPFGVSLVCIVRKS